MKKILIYYAHPANSRSSINSSMRSAVEDLDGVTVSDLYAQYPDFMIDVKAEQRLCEDHDVIIFQHPFYWYSTPPIVKQWFDLVLEHGWAYGSQGQMLKDKVFFQAISAGGDIETYQKGGYNEFTLCELTSPFRATAKLCQMKWLPPFAITGVHRGLPYDQIQKYSEDYRRVLIALRDQRFDYDAAHRHDVMNAQINDVVM